jgi:hypothetical protein
MRRALLDLALIVLAAGPPSATPFGVPPRSINFVHFEQPCIRLS